MQNDFKIENMANQFNSSKLLNDLVNSNELYLINTDQNGILLHVTRNLTDLTGYEMKELHKFHLFEIFDSHYKNTIESHLRNSLDHNNNDHLKTHLPLKLKNNNTLWVELYSSNTSLSDTNQLTITHTIRNVDDYKQLKDDFSDTETLHKLVINNNPDLIFVKDNNYRIVLANEAFLNLYPEDKRSSIIGTTTFEDYDHDEMTGFLENDKVTFKEGYNLSVEKITMPNGQRKTLETKKVRFKNSQGDLFLLGISKDITENHELIERLQKSNSDLNEFSYIAAHDLKSPMNAIRKIAGWLYEDCVDKLDEASLKHLELLMSRSERMLRLLDDLLEYSTVDKKDYPFKSINLETSIAQLIENHDPQIKYQLNIKSHEITAPKIPLQTILNNLISNAIKHHPNLSPNVVISIHRKTHQDWLVFEDNGAGIPEEHRKDALLVFRTLKPRDHVEGSGVGLSLVKKMAEYYSGTLILGKSDLGGLKVTIKWPINNFLKQ